MTRRIRDATDIVELVGSYVALKRAGSIFKGLCPFHDEKTPSFTVSPTRQTFKCFGCGAGGDVFKFVQLRDRVSFPEARRLLADRAGIPLEVEDRAGGSGGPGKRELAEANAWAQGVFRAYFRGAAGEQARRYVAGRGLAEAVVERFGLGLAIDSYDALIRRAAADRVDIGVLVQAGLVRERAAEGGRPGGYHDTFRNRLMFPIVEPGGRIVGFGGRTLGNDPAKYLNTPATSLFDKGRQLFGLDQARQAIIDRGRAIVVEGYTDCMMAHQVGFAETVATLGTAMTEAHASLLRRYCDRVILLFDSDEAGRRATERGLSIAVMIGLDVLITRVPEGKDPCDYLLSAGAGGMESLLKAAVPALEFRWGQLLQEYDSGATGPARRRAVEAYVQELCGWLSRGAIDHIQKGLLINQLSKILALPAEELHRQFDRMLRRPAGRVAGGGVMAGGSGRAAPGGAPQVDPEQEALRQVVEVLLNAPHLYSRAAGRFDPAAIRDPALSEIAAQLVEVLESGEPFRLDDFLGRFESPVFGRLVTDLQLRGERRGGYEATIEGALACLDACREVRAAAEVSERLRGSHVSPAAPQEPAAGDEDEQLRALAREAMRPHFSAFKHRRRFYSG